MKSSVDKFSSHCAVRAIIAEFRPAGKNSAPDAGSAVFAVIWLDDVRGQWMNQLAAAMTSGVTILAAKPA